MAFQGVSSLKSLEIVSIAFNKHHLFVIVHIIAEKYWEFNAKVSIEI
jgi:hypothetical protein